MPCFVVMEVSNSDLSSNTQVILAKSAEAAWAKARERWPNMPERITDNTEFAIQQIELLEG